MIRYPLDVAALRQAIGRLSATWLRRASERKRRFRRLGYYQEKGPIWSEVKPAYMELQHGKCLYCERRRPHTIDVDVEHFRPKGKVGAWQVPPSLAAEGLVCAPTPTPPGGYHLLAYNLLNYGAARKECNTPYKSDSFPIAGSYNLHGDDPAKMASELPLLIYPLGTLDADPETLIGFDGLSPVALPQAGHQRHRALATIAFFALGDAEARKDLFLERALLLVGLYPQLVEQQAGSGAGQGLAAATVQGLTSPDSPHTNCARSFQQLFNTSPAAAAEWYDAARGYLAKISMP